MGCDIHILVEVYDDEKGWILMKYNKETEKYEPFTREFPVKRSDETDEEFEERYDEYFDNSPNESLMRNYVLFSFLADVRNHYNKDLNIIIPLSKLRGFPEDVSKEAREITHYDQGGDVDCHSFTWYSIEELKKVEWNKIIGPMREKYYVKAPKFEKYLDENLIVCKPIKKEDIQYGVKDKSKVIKYARYRQLKDEERKKYNDYFVAFTHSETLSPEECKASRQLMEIVERVSQQYPKSRLLMYFDN